MTDQPSDKWWLESAMQAKDTEKALTTQDIDWDKGAAAELYGEFENAMAAHITDLVHRVLDHPEPSDADQEEHQMEQAQELSHLVHYALVRHLAQEYDIRDPQGPPDLATEANNLAAHIIENIAGLTHTYTAAQYIGRIQVQEIARAVHRISAATEPLYSYPMAEHLLPTREALTRQFDLLVCLAQKLAHHYSLDYAECMNPKNL